MSRSRPTVWSSGGTVNFAAGVVIVIVYSLTIEFTYA